ncbi:hypothetical protein GCM10027203_78480 [Nonomuraea fastidiosa]
MGMRQSRRRIHAAAYPSAVMRSAPAHVRPEQTALARRRRAIHTGNDISNACHNVCLLALLTEHFAAKIRIGRHNGAIERFCRLRARWVPVSKRGYFPVSG